MNASFIALGIGSKPDRGFVRLEHVGSLGDRAMYRGAIGYVGRCGNGGWPHHRFTGWPQGVLTVEPLTFSMRIMKAG